MAPPRKSRSVNKRFSSEASPDKDVGTSSKSKHIKKKLSDKLGPQWTKEELERFYDAYRKHGQDWRKVAAAVRNNRSVEMVEALFLMNRAYLSLPEGTASVAGLIAMMTDHYSVMGGSESEGEEREAPRKYQKRKRAKATFNESQEDVNQPHSIASPDGCLLFLKQAQAYGSQRRVTGKRTPRVPVPSSYRRDDREGSSPLSKRAKKPVDDNDDVAHIVARALTDASKREGPPKLSESPCRKTEHSESSPVKTWGKMSQTREAQSKLREGSRVRQREVGVYCKDSALMDMEGVGTVEVLRKGKKFYGKKVKVEEAEGINSDDSGEACSATEGLKSKSRKGKVDNKKKNKKPNFGDEFDALQALAELSASMLPVALMESESSAQIKEERTANDMDEKSSTLEATSTSHHGEKAKEAGPEDTSLRPVPAVEVVKSKKPKSSRQATTVDSVGKQPARVGSQGRKRKPKRLEAEPSTDSTQNKSMANEESAREEKNKYAGKAKRPAQLSAQSKQLKAVKTLEESSSTIDKKRDGADVITSTLQAPALGLAAVPLKPTNKRKIDLKKTLREWFKTGEIASVALLDESLSEHELKEKLSTLLCYPLARRRCIFEWFYSSIDYPWFSKAEFVDYLNHVGLGHVPRLTRLEWSVIRSSLGRPRRFSRRFLQEEREKLRQYRDSVRKHYTELRAGAREGLPTDLAKPLSVGNKVIAIHPKTRELHDGKILTVDHNKCSVLFDRDDLGVEFVMDIDCMPANPSEYMPEGLRKQVDKCLSISNREAQIYRYPNFGGSVIFPSNGLESANLSMNPLLKQVDTNGPILQGKVVAMNTTSPQLATDNKSFISYSKAREAEIQRGIAIQRSTMNEKEMEPEMLEIVKGSRSRAQAMVDAAIKAASSVKEGEDASKKIQEALDSIGKHQPLHMPMVPGIKQQEHSNGGLDHHLSQSPSNGSEPLANGSISQDGSVRNEGQMPSELISSCVATWLMIQMCTERQYPPADMAELIDAAVTSLHPQCPQNLPIYREIQTCMGRIKTQILALVPT